MSLLLTWALRDASSLIIRINSVMASLSVRFPHLDSPSSGTISLGLDGYLRLPSRSTAKLEKAKARAASVMEQTSRAPKWIFQSMKGSGQYYDLPNELRGILSLQRTKQIVHWEDAEVRLTEHDEPFPMQAGDLVLLYQGGAGDRGFHGLARIENLYSRCLDPDSRKYSGYTHKPVSRGREKRKHQLGVDLRYLTHFSPPLRMPSALRGSYRNRNLTNLGTGKLFRGTVHSLTDADYRALSAEVGGRLERLISAAAPEVRKNEFSGFSDEIFEACETRTSKIREVIDQLELLREVIEPKLLKTDGRLNGIVSRAKKRGTNTFQEWAWLMFTRAPFGKLGKPLKANLLTQLTVNVGRDCLFVGLCLRKRGDVKALLAALQSNPERFQRLVETLEPHEWIITRTGDEFGDKEPKHYEASELSVALLDPKLKWINAQFERGDETVREPEIADRIQLIFERLYPLFGLALRSKVALPLVPEGAAEEPEEEGPESAVKTDVELIREIEEALKGIGSGTPPDRANVPGKRGGHFVRTPTLPLNCVKRSIVCSDGKTRVCYLGEGYSEDEVNSNIALFDELRTILDRIEHSLGFEGSSLLQIVVTNPLTDARYLKEGGKENSCVLANLLRYEKNKQPYFWLITICREIAYILAGRLGYRHQIRLRELLMKALPTYGTDGK